MLFGMTISMTGQIILPIKPSDTHEGIDGKDLPHLVLRNPEVPAQGRLLLFLPGTVGRPAQYTEFLKTAANMGMDAIGLSYDNNVAMRDLCTTSTDRSCHEKARKEVIYGREGHPQLSVDSLNSIVHRTMRLLLYLANAYPQADWMQYLDEEGGLDWSRIVVAGHSQGSGHAGILAKDHAVDRCILIAGRDWLALYQEHAEWMQRTGLTPPDRYYGFIHRRDAQAWGNADEILEAWALFGMDQFGPLVNVDTLAAPFRERHMLTTNLDQPPGQEDIDNFFHKAIITDDSVIRDALGRPVYEAVWQYLLGDDLTTSWQQPISGALPRIQLYPNPASDWCRISWPSALQVGDYRIVDATGRIWQTGSLKPQLDIHTLPAGVYFIQVEIDGQLVVEKLQIR